MICDCCLMPTLRVERRIRVYSGLAFLCPDCLDLIVETGLSPATIADFVELCWTIDARMI
jgi:hypothetical protein